MAATGGDTDGLGQMDPDRWQKVSTLYHAALERESGERASFLAAACQGDDALRQEVASLLAHDPPPGYLSIAVSELTARVAPPAAVAGSQIGPYLIRSLLGAGGMGEVYRAHDSKLGRDVAIKVLPPEVAENSERKARLLREARAAASLNHPNICTIHEVGEASARAYIAMEVVEGQPLSARLSEGPLSGKEVVRYGLQLADAVAYAHDHGVVHRDLKSANVMLTPEGRVKVLDFGLAKRLSAAELSEVTTATQVSLTQSRAVIGTLPYMPPEQLRGEAADTRSDVWSLGVVLYEMTAGHRPFDGRTGFETSSAILHEAPLPLPPGIPAPLQIVIARCLEKAPARRYQRGAELRAALETLAAGSSTERPRWGTERSRRMIPAAASAAVLFLAGGLFWWNAPAIRQRLFSGADPPIHSIAVLPLDNLSGDPNEEYFVAGMHEALITDLSRIGLQKVIAKPSADALKGTKKSLRDIGRELSVDGLVTGSVLRANNRIQVTAQLVNAASGVILWANRYERNAGDVLSLQNEIVGAIAREMRGTLTTEQTRRVIGAQPIDPAAHDAYLKGRSLYSIFSNAPDKSRLDAAIAQFEQSIAIDPAYAPPYASLSAMYATASQTSFLPPGETFPKAKTAALKAVALDESLAEAHAALGQVALWYDWNWEMAEREIRRSLQLNPDSIDALVASETYSVLVAGRFDEAARTSQRIVDLDPLNVFSRVQPVWASYFSRRHDDSIRLAGNLLDVYPDNIMAPLFLSLNYAAKQMRPGVDAQCKKMMGMISGAFVAQPISTCVSAYAMVGETAESRRLLQRLEHPPAGLWADPPIFGGAYAGVGDVDRAIEWAEKGFAERAPNMVYLKASPLWDPIRGDARFQALMRRMNFPN